MKKKLLLGLSLTLVAFSTSCISNSANGNNKKGNSNNIDEQIKKPMQTDENLNQNLHPNKEPNESSNETKTETTSPSVLENTIQDQSKQKDPISTLNNSDTIQHLPNFPLLPPTFPGFQKPEHAISKPELEINQIDAYKKILDRSFAISFNVVTQNIENGVRNNDEISFLSTGTGWVLDYAWKNGVENSDELMLYIATNAHVYKYAYNTLDDKLRNIFPEYFTNKEQKGAKVASFGLGIPLKEPNLEQIESGRHEGNQNIVSYFINSKDQKYLDGLKDIKLVGEQIFSNPKTVFVATDFFDKKTNEDLLKKHSNYQPDFDGIQRIGKDFAVFAIKVKFGELTRQAQTDQNLKKLLDHIKNGINSIKNDVTLFSSKQYPNHDKLKIPYISYDYYSIYSHKDQYKDFNNKKDILSPNAKRIYIAGFPSDNDNANNQYFWKNYPKGTKIQDTAFTRRSFLNSAEVNNLLDEKTISYGIGVQGQVQNSSLYYGASGSLAINEFGMPVGIYSSISSKANDIKDTSNWGAFTFLVQNSNDPFYGPEHNLIDASDKTLYPHQEKSYRQNLKVLTQQDDFFKDFSKTALFESGI
ncbi:hypothetical protein RRG51_03070 [Mycoplasmopsis cynos]|uniref:MIP family Ig-specific serine endopeptidase n=1 Tax=Mycoplasmopsis cynos TaxID=171284 RepID=UPI002AFEC8E3|nr:hypothetical protein [Mycoplasmopsis cynos]WQQ15981.1 hypothetical protein RRG51_03070 [Mycoplasmopsis cynos]